MRRWELGLTFSVIVIFSALNPPCAVAEGGSLISSLSPKKGANDLGIIFNTSDLLFGLESYQAGLGGKIGWGNLCLRGLFDIAINGSSESFAVDAGATLEYHIIPGPISPYIGASSNAGYMTQASTISAITISIGAVAGVEVFVFEFLSIFAEYSITADFITTTDLQTSQTTFDYLINTRMGNNAKLGIVIYVMRSGAKAK